MSARSYPAFPPGYRPSPRQAEILAWLVYGLEDKEIARELHLTHRAVREHLERMWRATGLRGRVQLVVAWLGREERSDA